MFCSFDKPYVHCNTDWVQDKIRTEFTFEALCWEKSHIPELIWRAGDSTSNLIESTHSDVNREGVHCTLVRGIRKGQAFDAMKMKSLQVSSTPVFNECCRI
jgi:hypothetical protein